MLNYHPVNTPLAAGIQYLSEPNENLTSEEIQFMAVVSYDNAIGGFQYLVTMTR